MFVFAGRNLGHLGLVISGSFPQIMAMETIRTDAESLSRLIERRLAETNRQEQAAAFVQLGILRMLLDAIAKFANPTRDVSLADGGAFHPGSLGPDSGIPAVFLTRLNSDHQALVFDFDSLVDQVGELSVALHEFLIKESASETEIQRRFYTLWTDELHEHLPVRKQTPLTGSLAALINVAELGPLDEAYQRLDFSPSRLRATDFLRK